MRESLLELIQQQKYLLGIYVWMCTGSTCNISWMKRQRRAALQLCLLMEILVRSGWRSGVWMTEYSYRRHSMLTAMLEESCVIVWLVTWARMRWHIFASRLKTCKSLSKFSKAALLYTSTCLGNLLEHVVGVDLSSRSQLLTCFPLFS